MKEHGKRVEARAIGATCALALAAIVGFGIGSAQGTDKTAAQQPLGPPQAWGFNSSTLTGQRGLATQLHPGFLVIGQVGSYVLNGAYGRHANPCAYAYGTGAVAGYQGQPRSTTGSSLDGAGSENIVTGELQTNCGE